MICGAKDKEGVSDQRKHDVQHESEACTTFNIGSEAEPRAGTPAPLKSAWRAAGLGGQRHQKYSTSEDVPLIVRLKILPHSDGY
jgi:hypothetical protein